MNLTEGIIEMKSKYDYKKSPIQRTSPTKTLLSIIDSLTLRDPPLSASTRISLADLTS